MTVTVSATGDYGVTTGAKTVTIGTGGTATLIVPTTGGSVDEADGSVTATVSTGSNYTVSTSTGAAAVTVSDDDPPASDLLAALEAALAEQPQPFIEAILRHAVATVKGNSTWFEQRNPSLILVDVSIRFAQSGTVKDALAQFKTWYNNR